MKNVGVGVGVAKEVGARFNVVKNACFKIGMVSVCLLLVIGCRGTEPNGKRMGSDRLNASTLRELLTTVQNEKPGAAGKFRLKSIDGVAFVPPASLHVVGMWADPDVRRDVKQNVKNVDQIEASYDLSCSVEQGIVRVHVSKTDIPGLDLVSLDQKRETGKFEEAISRALTIVAMGGTADAGVTAVGVDQDALVLETEAPYP